MNKSLQPWIVDMMHQLQQDDPYGHLVTTSYAEGRHTHIWQIPELSFNQQHDYTNHDPALEFAAALADFRRASRTKPLLVGDHGHIPSGQPPAVELIVAVVHFHNGLWAAPFTGLAGSALAWNWNDLVEPNNLWPQYKSLATFFQGEDLAPTQAMTASVTATATATAGSGAIALSLQSPTRALVWVRSQQFEATAPSWPTEKPWAPGRPYPTGPSRRPL